MRPYFLPPALAALVLALALGCTDSSGPGTPVTRQPANLNILTLRAGHPALFNDTVSFWAKKGQDAEGAIYFQDSQGSQGEEYLRLRIGQQSLLTLPNGQPIAVGDSVLITVRVLDPDSILFQFEPGGLQFDPAHPAALKIEYGEAGDDFDHNGTSGEPSDQLIEHQLAIWRQPLLTDPFTLLLSVKLEGFNEIEAKLTGFSRYAIAY
ncbi:MAG: hypothetical protein ACREMO_03495 [Gemmatimonadales bacterium]